MNSFGRQRAGSEVLMKVDRWKEEQIDGERSGLGQEWKEERIDGKRGGVGQE